MSTELVLNGDFETDDPTTGIVPTSWTQVTATGTFLTAKPTDMVASAVVVSGEGGVGRQDVTVVSGAEYTFIVTASEATTGDTQFQVELGSSTGAADYLDFTSAGVGGNDAQQPTVTFTATSTTASITLSNVGTDESAECQFDDASIIATGVTAAANLGGRSWPKTVIIGGRIMTARDPAHLRRLLRMHGTEQDKEELAEPAGLKPSPFKPRSSRLVRIAGPERDR